MSYQYQFKILSYKFYDGDTVNLVLDLGFDLKLYQKCRLLGIDTFEIRGGTKQTKAAGYLGKAKAKEFVDNLIALDKPVAFHCLAKKGKFGRALGDLICEGESLCEYLVEQRLACRYDGKSSRRSLTHKAKHTANLKYLLDNNMIEGD